MTDESREIIDTMTAMFDALDARITAQDGALVKALDEQHGRTISEVKTIIENGIQRDVQTLAGEMMFMRKRMEHIEKDTAEMKDDVQIIKAAVTAHSKELETLRNVQ